ncbi:MAG TPA: sigma-70 family RNA polymerase sigma factor [Bacteroidia bacterium]|nr:sigma-70 family RNA polymerase sigma factor [Bacteroidia bacterium]
MEGISKYHATSEDMLKEQLLVESARKDPEQFKGLYNKYYERIFLYVWQRVDDKELAFDVTSQVFLKAMMNLHKYEFKGVPFASWLYRIAKSEVYTAFRQQQAKRTVNIDTSGLGDMMDDMEEDKYAPYIDIIKEAVTDLEEDDMQFIEMRFFEKRAFKEIAEILGITENNAKVKTYRILEKLKKILLEKKKNQK